MRFVHLSDFHIKKEGIKDLSQIIVRALIRDLSEFNSQKKIDFIFFTGDLIDQGGKSFESIDRAFEEFEKNVILPLTTSLKMDMGRFIFIPGNHDIDRDADDEIDEIGLSNFLDDEPKVSGFIDKNMTKGIKRILPFKQFEGKIHKNTVGHITNFHSSYIHNLEGVEVGISAFNTAWRCYDSDKDHGNILLGTRQITESRNYIENCDIKIALMHHQFDFLKDFDIEAVKPSIEREYDMVFCGHVHKGSNYSQSDVFGEVFVSISPSNTSANIWIDDQRYLNGYAIIDYSPYEGTITVNNRKYSRNHEKYLPNVELGLQNGVRIYDIKKKEKQNRKVKNDYNQSELDSLNYQLSYDNFVSEISTEKYTDQYIISHQPTFNNSKYLKFSKSIFFNKHMQEIFNKSSKYAIYENDVEVCLLMMDKILKDLDNKVFNYIENIDQIFSNIENDINLIKNIKELYEIIKIWLNKLQTINRGNTETKNDDDVFGIALFNEFESSSDDFVEILLSDSKETIKYINQNNEIRIELKSKHSLIKEVILLFALPIIVNIETFRRIGVTGDINLIQSKEIIQILKLTYEEYSSHKNSIKGRENEINAIIQSLEKNRFTLVKGIRGVGKSAIISSVMEDIGKRYKNPLFLLFSFKYSNNILEFIITVIEQCNLAIINNIDMDEIMEVIKPDNKETKFTDKESFVSNYMLLKPYFYEAIKRAMKENGKICLVLDSLEVVGHLEDKIKYLIEDLPSMCSIILVSDNNNECINWLINGEHANVIDVEPFNRDIIPLFTKLSDEDSSEKALNDKVYLKTKGKILELNKILNSSSPLTEGTIDDISNAHLIVDPEYAEVERVSLNNRILEESLLLFSVFENIEPLSLDYVQSFLEFRDIAVRMPTIRYELRKIENQLSNIKFGRVRFIRQDLPRFLLTTFFSPRDVENFIRYIFEWISTEEKIDTRFISEFLRKIETEKLIENTIYEEMVECFIESLIKIKKENKLYLIGKYMLQESHNNLILPLRLLTKASESGNIRAMVFLGLIYMKGEKVEKNLSLAEELLRKASNLGDADAKAILGVLLFEESEDIYKIEESMKLLEESTNLGNKSGKIQLAIRLLIGGKFEQNLKRANQLFFELIEESHVEAIRIMGTRYLYGHWIERNLDEGNRLLNIAISKGNVQAKFALARYKVRLGKSEEEVNEGIQLLEELIVNNNLDAKVYYTKVLITGPISIRDVPSGIKLLKELANEGVEECQLDYAIHLFNGEFIKQDVEEAKDILDRLVERDYLNAKTFYGELLIDGEYYIKNTQLGLSILTETAELGDEYAKKSLALRYAYGYGINKDLRQAMNILYELVSLGDGDAEYLLAKLLLTTSKSTNETEIKKAINLLEKAEKAGSVKAKVFLGEIYIDGDYVNKNIEKGLEYLNYAVELNDSEAMRELGYRYLHGLGLPSKESDALQLLNKSMLLGNKLAKTVLGHAVVLDKLNIDVSYGIQLLEESAIEESNAMRIMGKMLLFGNRVEQDKERGEELVRNAYRKGDKGAGIQLARLMLDGVYLEKNVDEGKRILFELIDAEHEEAFIEEARRLIIGNGLEKNIIKGLGQLNTLSDNGNLDAMYYLAQTILVGPEDVPKDFRKGEKLLREAESKNHEESRRLLAKLISDGIIKATDDSESIFLLEKAAKENDYLAMQILAEYHLEGNKVEPNSGYAIELLENSIKGKDHMCMVDYGLKLIKGEFVKQDIQRGISLLQETVLRGSLQGKYELAKIYLSSEVITNKYEEGLSLISQLVNDGEDKAKLLFARYLALGNKMEVNYEKATQLFEELVAEKSNRAILVYSELLLDGFYLKKDMNKGEKLIRQLIQEGDQVASLVYATRLINGDGVQKHISNGINRLRRLAENGVKEAMLEYGIRLKKGNKVGKNIKKANKFINNAIENLSSDECHALGMLAYRLDDYDIATKLFVRSYNKGYLQSGTSLAYMLRRNEVRGTLPTYNIYLLLQYSLRVNSDTAVINLALSVIGDNDLEDTNWKYADLLIKNLFKCSESADWWYETAKKRDDSEGHLVVGWLVKHNIIRDPDNFNYKDRFKIARSKWNIPDWLMS
ncbi:metallophosphoesterase [Paenibacillus jiagnxiensis]|uniref:metallophosphoesterase n=1 Tax=Paenibacillus jiagnxiensis TaxID=3228926 RepID=UPI0033B25931